MGLAPCKADLIGVCCAQVIPRHFQSLRRLQHFTRFETCFLASFHKTADFRQYKSSPALFCQNKSSSISLGSEDGNHLSLLYRVKLCFIHHIMMMMMVFCRADSNPATDTRTELNWMNCQMMGLMSFVSECLDLNNDCFFRAALQHNRNRLHYWFCFADLAQSELHTLRFCSSTQFFVSMILRVWSYQIDQSQQQQSMEKAHYNRKSGENLYSMCFNKP